MEPALVQQKATEKRTTRSLGHAHAAMLRLFAVRIIARSTCLVWLLQRGRLHPCRLLCGENEERIYLPEAIYWRINERRAVLLREGNVNILMTYERHRTFFSNQKREVKKPSKEQSR